MYGKIHVPLEPGAFCSPTVVREKGQSKLPKLDRAVRRLRENDSELTTLDLYCYGNDRDDAAKALADALCTNTSLSELCLWNNKIDVEGATALAGALRIN